MPTVYIVVQEKFDIDLLKWLLPTSLTIQVEFVDGGGNYGAKSSAITLLALDQIPLALVLDPDDNDAISERRFAESFLYRAAIDTPYQVFVVTPELETIFFQSLSLLERVFDRQFTDLEWELGKQNPRSFLLKAANATDKKQYNEIRYRLLDALQDEDVEKIRQHELISGLIDFLTEVTNRETAN